MADRHCHCLSKRKRYRAAAGRGAGSGVRTNQSLDTLGVAHACDGLLTPATERSVCPSPSPLVRFCPTPPARCIRCFPRSPRAVPFSTRYLPDPPPLFFRAIRMCLPPPQIYSRKPYHTHASRLKQPATAAASIPDSVPPAGDVVDPATIFLQVAHMQRELARW
jgi:hypothetical protein